MRRFHILAATLLVAVCLGCANSEKAERLAGEFIESNFPGHNVNNIACLKRDSDGDGYVSCNVSLTNNTTGEVVMPALECSGGWVQIFHHGCRIPKAHIAR
jgi:hypothetical protein